MNSFSYCVEKFSLIPAHYGGTGHSGKKKQNTKYIKWKQITTRWRMLKDFSKERFSHKSTTVWTYILEEPSVLRQALGRQRFSDMVEGEQRSVLLQAILTLDWLQQNGNELRPLLGAIQARHLRYQHCNLGCNLQQNRDRKQKKNDHWQIINRGQAAMLEGFRISGRNQVNKVQCLI